MLRARKSPASDQGRDFLWSLGERLGRFVAKRRARAVAESIAVRFAITTAEAEHLLRDCNGSQLHVEHALVCAAILNISPAEAVRRMRDPDGRIEA